MSRDSDSSSVAVESPPLLGDLPDTERSRDTERMRHPEHRGETGQVGDTVKTVPDEDIVTRRQPRELQGRGALGAAEPARPPSRLPFRSPPPAYGDAPRSAVETGRVIGEVGAPHLPPRLVCVAGLHGNEPAGIFAVRRVVHQLEAETPELHGRFVGLAGNLKALEAHRRFLDRDLNRVWTPASIEVARRQPEALEDEELLELVEHLEGLIRQVPQGERHDFFVLDLHTASGPGPAFTILDDTLPNRDFALTLQVPVVLGIEEVLEGTVMDWLSDHEVTAVGFESGRHDDPGAVDRAEAALWVALEVSGVLAPDSHPKVEESRRLLQAASRELPRVVEVRHRHVITPEDGFRVVEGLAGFERVEQGQILGRDRRGPVAAREDALVLMPLYQEQGDEGFFLVRPVRPVWLAVSRAVRHLKLERILHLMPGVRRHPELPGSFVVDRKVARFVAPELFHLLGYRRRGPAEGRHLTMTRRIGDS